MNDVNGGAEWYKRYIQETRPSPLCDVHRVGMAQWMPLDILLGLYCLFLLRQLTVGRTTTSAQSTNCRDDVFVDQFFSLDLREESSEQKECYSL